MSSPVHDLAYREENDHEVNGEAANSSHYPVAVRAAIRYYAQNIDEVKAMAKALSAKRKKTTDAAKVVKKFMNEQNMNTVRVGRQTFRRNVKPTIKVDQKRFESSELFSDSTKSEFIAQNTVDEPKFKIS